MRLSELQQKDIVNILDGKRVGRIIDAEIDEQGNIKRLIVEEKMKLRSFLFSSGEVSVNFMNIKNIIRSYVKIMVKIYIWRFKCIQWKNIAHKSKIKGLVLLTDIKIFIIIIK